MSKPTDCKLMQQALDVLAGCLDHPDAQDAIDALRERLAQPEQEPVAWLDVEMESAYTPTELDGGATDGLIPLYAHPPAQPVLTSEREAELLDALQGFIQHGTCFDEEDMARARAAIAKATK
jgi:hypothetical protein